MPTIELPPSGPGTNRDAMKSGDPAAGTKENHPQPETGLERYNRERREKRQEKDRQAKIIREAVKRYKKCVEFESDNRAAALEDLKFKAGKQWPADIETQRAQDKRPCITINGLPTFTHQIANDIRQNRQGINLSPLGSDSTKEAAELYAAMFRGIERDSAADIAYDTAVGSAIDIGFGYWRYLTDYESPETFNQIIVIKRVRNPFTVYLDPARQEPDGSDSKFGFVSELVDREDFRAQWPNAQEVSWKEKGMGEEWKEWSTKDQIRVAEYFTLEYDKRRLVQLENGHVGWWDELDEALQKQVQSGKMKIMHDRESETPRVTWYRITSSEVLEEKEWLGKWIPIVEVLGDEIDLEGKVVKSGVIRNAKDPMRMKNYWATAATEVVALAPKTPYILAEGQDEGYEDEWNQANTKPLPVLHYVPVKGENGQMVPPPQRQPSPQVPAGMAEREKQAEQDLMRTTGVRFDATINERMYDESGKALKELRRSGDIGSFHYSDNFSRSLRHGGRIMLDLAPKIYDTERFISAVAEDGTDSRIKLDPTMATATGRVPNPSSPPQGAQVNSFMQPGGMQPGGMQQGGMPGMPVGMPGMPGGMPQGMQAKQMMEPLKVLNLKKGQFSVTVTTGPSYATRRIEAQEQMSNFIGKVPEQMRGIVAALIAKYSDWPGSTELFKALSKMLPPGVLMPDQKDLPPAVAAFLGNLQQQIQRLMMERMQIMRELTDKKVDQGLARDKINKDFEAKILKLAQQAHEAMDKLSVQSVNQVMEGQRHIHEMLAGEEAQRLAAAGPQGQPPMQPVAQPAGQPQGGAGGMPRPPLQ